MTGRMYTRDGNTGTDEGDVPQGGKMLVARYEAGSGSYRLEQVDGVTSLYRYRNEHPESGTGSATGDAARAARDDTAATLKAINQRNRQHHKRPDSKA